MNKKEKKKKKSDFQTRPSEIFVWTLDRSPTSQGVQTHLCANYHPGEGPPHPLTNAAERLEDLVFEVPKSLVFVDFLRILRGICRLRKARHYHL